MYIDGFVVAVPRDKKAEYEKSAQQGWDLFKSFGATRAVECWEDDVPDGEVTSFPMAVKRQDNEVCVFSWIEWPSKTERDACFAKMQEMQGEGVDWDMPFDGKRMIMGGFIPLFDKKA